jgi:hypothetical protein
MAVRRLVVIALALVGIVGCGTKAAPTHLVGGTFTLEEGTLSATKGASCSSKSSGYDDVRAGTTVVVSDGDGKVLATGQLGPGQLGPHVVQNMSYCVFPIAVPSVPEAPFYRVEVGNRGAQTYSLADMQAKNWTLALTLG